MIWESIDVPLGRTGSSERRLFGARLVDGEKILGVVTRVVPATGATPHDLTAIERDKMWHESRLSNDR